MSWDKFIPKEEIKNTVTDVSVKFAEDFGKYLGKTESRMVINNQGKRREETIEKLTTNQLRKFFGEVKRQQMRGYNSTDFILLKPKLAYAVGRAKSKDAKIVDFYKVISDAIDKVENEAHFKNFIKIFEAIVAYHKVEENK